LRNRYFKQQRPHVYEVAATRVKPLRITSAVSSASLSVDSSWRQELDLPIAYMSACVCRCPFSAPGGVVTLVMRNGQTMA